MFNILAISVLVLAFFAPCVEGGGMSLLGSKGSFTVKPKGWANPYVTNGLIGMWDGEWNVAGGQHDGTATTWVDISGNNRDAVLTGTYSWGANYWHVESVTGQGLATWQSRNLGTDQTIEFVIEASDRQAYGRVIAEGQDVASPILRENNVYMFGYGIDKGATISGYNVLSRHVHQITHANGGPMLYYLDGNLVWTANDATANSTGGTGGHFANRSGYDRGIDADYFTMRRYNRVLTSAELAANYAVDQQRFNIS